MFENVKQIIKNKDLIIPKILFDNYKLLKINEKELIFIIYVLNNSDEFNPKVFSNDLNTSIPEVMDTINKLTDKGIIKINLKKINNVRKELIDLDGLFDKLTLLITKEEDKTTNIFDIFEKEFARTLSPMEYEIINAWLEHKISEETITLALKEAIYNGVTNLRYIDKILCEWEKKGIKTSEDIEKDRKKVNKINVEDFDYDWLNDKSE